MYALPPLHACLCQGPCVEAEGSPGDQDRGGAGGGINSGQHPPPDVLQKEIDSCPRAGNTTHSSHSTVGQRCTSRGGWWQGNSRAAPVHQALEKAVEAQHDDSELSRLLQIMDQAWVKRPA